MKGWTALFLLFGSILFAQDTHCPAYPIAVRQSDQRILDRDRDFQEFRLGVTDRPKHALFIPPSNNFVDDLVFGKLRNAGVDAAELTQDSEFVRRIYLDLTGRIPTLEQAQSFL